MTRRTDPAAVAIADAAAGLGDLDLLAAAMRSCTACVDLASARSSVVVGDFPPEARLLVVGEAPGAQEDTLGRPFVGKAGRLLDELLAEVGVRRETVAVANVLKCRPPANRPPTRAEARRCSGWLDRQLALLDPPIVTVLGGTALAWALGPGVRLGDVRGQVLPWRDRRLVVSYHPSAAIRFGPNGAPLAALREDLRLVAELLCAS